MEIFIAILGSGLLSAIVSGAISLLSKHMDRKYAKEDKQDGQTEELEAINKRLHKAECDNVRLQMLVLIKLYPEDKAEIMRAAEHYFNDLKGNWYMTSIFNSWITNNNIAKPDWFDKE